MTKRLRRIDLLTAVAVVMAAGAVAEVEAGPTPFAVTELGTLGGAQSIAYGLNDLDQAVGQSNATNGQAHAFLWSEGVMTDLGTLGGTTSKAWAINNAGTIVGESLPTGRSGSANFRAFIYQNQLMTPLPTLGGTWSVGYDINESGVICGLSYNASQQEKAVTWTGGVITNIAAVGGATDQRTRAYGLNDAGVVTGWGYTPLGGPNNAFKFTNPQWQQIGGFGQFQNSEAYDVGSSGIVVGASGLPTGGDWHAAIWLPNNPTVAVILGTLPGFPLAELNDINSKNQAVGRAYVDINNSRAIYYDGTTLHDLNDFLPAGFQGFLWDAREINENGVIAATASHNGVLRAVLLSPSFAPGDIDHNGVVDVDDLLAVINAWGTCPPKGKCAADTNGDNQVDVDDLLNVINNWG